MSRFFSKLWNTLHSTWPANGGQHRRASLSVETLQERVLMAADAVEPVLMVISNQDFWYQDYADTRASLDAQGLDVVVAAETTEVSRPHANSGQGADGGFVRPDLALTDVEAEDYSGIVFSGGWGMAQYQYGFEGTYHNSIYNGEEKLRATVNDLINDFVSQDKNVGAVCYGVSVLAYARVDGESLLEGRTVTGWNGAAPGAEGGDQTSREQIESNGAVMLESGAIGDPRTQADDVFIDGKIITAENYDSASAFGKVFAREVIADGTRTSSVQTLEAATEREHSQVKPVLMVIANQDFYHREYFETRQSLEAAGLEVIVAAATTEVATPHAISVVEGREPNVQPDLALSDVNAEDYSAIVFVGGYGAASYQYANETTYDNSNPPVLEDVAIEILSEDISDSGSKLGQLDAIMDNLNEDLRDILDQYVSTAAESRSSGAALNYIFQTRPGS